MDTKEQNNQQSVCERQASSLQAAVTLLTDGINATLQAMGSMEKIIQQQHEQIQRLNAEIAAMNKESRGEPTVESEPAEG